MFTDAEDVNGNQESGKPAIFKNRMAWFFVFHFSVPSLPCLVPPPGVYFVLVLLTRESLKW